MRIFIGILLLISANTHAQLKEGLLWEVTGNGLEEPSYIYGTMHVQDERVFEWTKATKKAFRKADIVLTELNLKEVNAFELLQGLMMPDSVKLKDLIGEAYYQELSIYFRDSMGMPLDMYERISPMMISSILSNTGAFGMERTETLDAWIFNEAERRNKEADGLETASEQMAVFMHIPWDMQGEMLQRSIDYAYGRTDELESMMKDSPDSLMHFYVNGQLDEMYDYSIGAMDTESPRDSIFIHYFLTRRNYIMVDRLENYMPQGKCFVAVGALHLPGPDGQIAILRKRGYTVRKR